MVKIQHTVLLSFPELEDETEMIGVIKKFNSLDGITASFGRGEGDSYTHCLLIIADDELSLKQYLHHEYHLIDWMQAVKDHIKGIVVFDSELVLTPLSKIRVALVKATGEDDDAKTLPARASFQPCFGKDFLERMEWPDKTGGFTHALTCFYDDEDNAASDEPFLGKTGTSSSSITAQLSTFVES